MELKVETKSEMPFKEEFPSKYSCEKISEALFRLIQIHS